MAITKSMFNLSKISNTSEIYLPLSLMYLFWKCTVCCEAIKGGSFSEKF